jgi:hypothetical protein
MANTKERMQKMAMDSFNNKNWLVKAWNSGLLPLGLLRAFFGAGMIAPVSYTHLTLPTSP